jgi:hypothetical protein
MGKLYMLSGTSVYLSISHELIILMSHWERVSQGKPWPVKTRMICHPISPVNGCCSSQSLNVIVIGIN